MNVLLTIKSESNEKWKARKDDIWFYLEDVPINIKDFSITHTGNGFSMVVHEYAAIRARDALRNLVSGGYVKINTQPITDNPEIVPVKKRSSKRKNKKEKISNIKIVSRDDVGIGRGK